MPKKKYNLAAGENKMADILVHDLDPETIERLEQMARNDGASPGEEARRILQSIVAGREPLAAVLAEAIRAGFGERVLDDSAELIREDRRR